MQNLKYIMNETNEPKFNNLLFYFADYNKLDLFSQNFVLKAYNYIYQY